jgi:hypothetical protein
LRQHQIETEIFLDGGFNVSIDTITDVDVRNSYKKMWQAAGSPEFGLPDDYLQGEYEKRSALPF